MFERGPMMMRLMSPRNYGAVPNARLLCQGDIANYCCAGNDPGTWMDRGTFI
jgi:hypothetical protein